MNMGLDKAGNRQASFGVNDAIRLHIGGRRNKTAIDNCKIDGLVSTPGAQISEQKLGSWWQNSILYVSCDVSCDVSGHEDG
jgi:hypothetical protein